MEWSNPTAQGFTIGAGEQPLRTASCSPNRLTVDSFTKILDYLTCEDSISSMVIQCPKIISLKQERERERPPGLSTSLAISHSCVSNKTYCSYSTFPSSTMCQHPFFEKHNKGFVQRYMTSNENNYGGRTIEEYFKKMHMNKVNNNEAIK